MIKKIRETFKKNEKEYTSELEPMYLYYTTNISNPIMAASLRCCVFLVCMYEAIEPDRILDLGTGFSSYAIRYFKGKFGLSTEIYSIDSSEDWVEISKDFCQKNSVDTDHFYHWNEIKDKNISFELIFMDIDFSKKRVNYYDHVCKQFVGNNTFMLVDDMHKPILRNKVKTLKCKTNHNVRDETKPKGKKRFSCLLEFGD
jgi:predicted O-methyltransferase YrrM